MRDPRTIFHVSSILKAFFFSTDHCQEKVHDSYVPITSYTNDQTSVREYWGKELGYKEVANPDPNYQV